MNQKIARLMVSIANYPSAPSARQLKDIDGYQAELQQGLAEVNKLDGDLPKLNKAMQDAGVPYFTVDPAAVAAPPAGRGGGR